MFEQEKSVKYSGKSKERIISKGLKSEMAVGHDIPLGIVHPSNNHIFVIPYINLKWMCSKIPFVAEYGEIDCRNDFKLDVVLLYSKGNTGNLFHIVYT